MADFNKMDRLRRKMQNLCVIIEKLLRATPRPSKSLWEHISKLEELITSLPEEVDGAEQLIDLYQDKVVLFWQLFECGELPPPSKPPLDNNNTHQWSSLAPLKEDNDADGAPGNGSNVSQTGGGTNQAQPNGGDCSPRLAPSPIPPPSADQIRSVLKSAFERVEPMQTFNLDGMKQLLMMVTKARAVTMPHWKDVSLLSDIFQFAFEKLPEQQQKLYRSEYNCEKKWLRDLRNFIQDEIDYYCIEEMERKLEKNSGEQQPQQRKSGHKVPTCFHCKIDGHLVGKCPVLKNTLCAQCLRWSHSESRCRNPALFIQITDF